MNTAHIWKHIWPGLCCLMGLLRRAALRSAPSSGGGVLFVCGEGLGVRSSCTGIASGIQPAWTHHFLAELLYSFVDWTNLFFGGIHLGFQHHANRCIMGSALASPFPTSARDGSGLCGDQAWGWVQANPIPHEVSSISILSGNWVFKIMLIRPIIDH